MKLSIEIDNSGVNWIYPQHITTGNGEVRIDFETGILVVRYHGEIKDIGDYHGEPDNEYIPLRCVKSIKVIKDKEVKE